MKCVILGAGKIARGFIGHLLHLSGIDFCFVEKSDALCDMLNARGRYTIHILGCPEKDCVIEGKRALKYSEKDAVTAAISEADAIFTAVGGKNLGGIIGILKDGIEHRAAEGKRLNIVTCENWKKPADIIRDELTKVVSAEAQDYLREKVGITEAVIMRSAIEPDAEAVAEDPVCVNVQDFWDLPVDKSRVVGDMPPIQGLRLMDEFGGFLERKFYTYNAANGTVSFVGGLLGHRILSDAAHDERILPILEGVYRETAQALSKKHAFPLDEQLKFTRSSKKKLQDRAIVDYIERNARDPMRKLGPDDRLIGSARLVMEYGIRPENLAIAAAAAIHYDSPGDESADELKRMLTEEGVDAVLEKVCKLDPQGALAMLIKEKEQLLKEWGWINE